MERMVPSELLSGDGVVVGATAWLVGSLLTFLIGVTGLSFFTSVLVDAAPLVGTFAAYRSMHGFAGLVGGELSLLVLTVVPVVVVVGAGFVTARSGGLDVSPRKTVSSVAAGYAVTMGLTDLLVFLLPVGSGFAVPGPRLSVGAVLTLLVDMSLVGVCFPLVFGSLGVALARV